MAITAHNQSWLRFGEAVRAKQKGSLVGFGLAWIAEEEGSWVGLWMVGQNESSRDEQAK